jgi:hypothetical protein
VPQDEVDLVRAATPVRAEHDNVRRVRVQFLRIKAGGRLQHLQVCTTTLQALSEPHFVPARQANVGIKFDQQVKPRGHHVLPLTATRDPGPSKLTAL